MPTLSVSKIQEEHIFLELGLQDVAKKLKKRGKLR